MSKNNVKNTIDPTLGLVLKALRESKGCTQKEAAGTSLSCPHLSNFEHGKTELSAHLLLELLKNINVNVIEFQSFYDNHLSSQLKPQTSNQEISEAYMTGNIFKLEHILSIFEDKSNGVKASKRSKLEVIRIKSIISLLDSSRRLSSTDLFFLKSYFMQLKEWGKYDIALLGQSYTNFDIATLAILTNHMLNPSQITIQLESNQHALIQTVLNVITFFVDNRQFEKANNLINHLKNMNIHEYYMYEKLTFVYNIAYFDYSRGDKSALNTMKKCQEILEFCDCLNTAGLVSKEISNLK
ncbi:Positive transcriptional regulator MutR family [Lactococcus lactis subsp. lactis]|uniref:Rgg/GadR/MutR family transcriptional regulator n=1 Tax=Lactococcus lactis TaxID=1358 RepID=UPI00071C20EA|nr:Rgg/GadR/MutR family transcriptional regulator [Lactococcus lactis]KST91478.1 Positive transcriptional regulator MutR family [Lactococcus lactis subsp. lactis]